MTSPEPTPRPVRIAVLTVSDTRTEATDRSGALLIERLTSAGHTLHSRRIIPDDVAVIDETVTTLMADPTCDVVLSTGGTGITGRDVTVDVFERHYTKAIIGFGELFRQLSYADIGASTIQSRASGGLAGTTLLFALPGSTGACALGWDKILAHQLDVRSKPCNLVALMNRFDE
ncbi:MAG: molybdenum cofactor biosynthesis protein [Deltaproteobacteria bacterium]|nr:MAG: molybdenum cofactor biosynthesis protein [Deltaproteobacteria bacterium]